MEKGLLIEKIDDITSRIDAYFKFVESNSVKENPSWQLNESRIEPIQKQPNNAKSPLLNKEYNVAIGARLSRLDELNRILEMVWLSVQKHPELDICWIQDDLHNYNIFQIAENGACFTPVLITKQIWERIDNPNWNFPINLTELQKNKTMQVYYSSVTEQPRELRDTINVLNRTYKYRKGCFRIANVKCLKKVTFPTYCKYYIRLGYCSNPNCKYTHDYRTRALCPHYKSHQNEQGCGRLDCSLSHEPNEYNSTDDKQTKREATGTGSHICRSFAYLGFCYRGYKCPFLHRKICPDFYAYGHCFVESCRLDKVRSSTAVLPFHSIPLEQYLLPPLLEKDGALTNGSWYGLYKKTKLLEDRVKGVSMRNHHPVVDLTESTSSDDDQDCGKTHDLDDSDEFNTWEQESASASHKDGSLDATAQDYIPFD